MWVTEKYPPARISSDGGLVAGVTKKTLLAVFQVPTEEDGGRQEVWVTRRPPCERRWRLVAGRVWATNKDPSDSHLKRGRGDEWWCGKNPPPLTCV